MNIKRDLIFTIGTLLIVLLVGVGLGRAIYKDLTVVTGGLVHNVQEEFSEGITVDGSEVINTSGQYVGRVVGSTSPSSYPQFGASTTPGCIIMGDTDAGGLSYSTVLNGTMTTTGGTSGQFTIPEDCQ